MAGKIKTNTIFVNGNITYIFPTNNVKPIIIDTDDYEKVKDYCWHMNKNKEMKEYGRSRERVTKRIVFIQRLILEEPDGVTICHANEDTFDNRKVNLKMKSKKGR